MVNRVAHHIGRSPYVLHRLDMPTSGLLLRQVAPRRPGALDAVPRPSRLEGVYRRRPRRAGGGSVDAPIAPHPTDTTLSVAAAAAAAEEWLRERGKPALTHFRVLGAVSDGGAAPGSRRRVSGRMHQIRVHAGACRPPPPRRHAVRLRTPARPACWRPA